MEDNNSSIINVKLSEIETLFKCLLIEEDKDDSRNLAKEQKNNLIAAILYFEKVRMCYSPDPNLGKTLEEFSDVLASAIKFYSDYYYDKPISTIKINLGSNQIYVIPYRNSSELDMFVVLQGIDNITYFVYLFEKLATNGWDYVTSIISTLDEKPDIAIDSEVKFRTRLKKLLESRAHIPTLGEILDEISNLEIAIKTKKEFIEKMEYGIIQTNIDEIARYKQQLSHDELELDRKIHQKDEFIETIIRLIE